MLVLPYLSSRVTAFSILLVTSVISGLGVIGSAFITNALGFAWVFGTVLGFLSAFTYMPAVWIAVDVMPQRKGTIMGVGLSSYAIAPSIYGILFTFLVNPNDLSPVGESIKYFTSEVYSNVPSSIIYLGVILLIVGVLGTFCLGKHKGHASQTDKKTKNLRQILSDHRFWYLCAFLYLKGSMYYYLMNIYKDLAFRFMNDDYFIAWIGSCAFISAGAGRLTIGRLMDYYNWKNLILAVVAIEIVIGILLYHVACYRYVYGVLVVIEMLLSSPSYLISWMMTEKVYPNDKWVFAVVNLAVLFDLLAAYLIETYITGTFGYEASLGFISAELGVCLLLVGFLYGKCVYDDEGLMER